METQTKTDGKTSIKQRVVLNLSIDQAKELAGFIGKHNQPEMLGATMTIEKLRERIEKTLTKHEALQ
jgi:hypothetical protein